MTLTHKQKFLLLAPAIALPFCCMIFFVLGGGKGNGSIRDSGGLNSNLPGTSNDPKKGAANKMAFYQKADQDSVRKKQSEQQDPYHPYITSTKRMDFGPKDSIQRKTDELLQELNQLRQLARQGGPAAVPVRPMTPPPAMLPPAVMPPVRPWSPPVIARALRLADTPARDPQLDRLNSMLDKVIRIQHPAEGRVVASGADNGQAETMLPADSTSNSIAAVIPADQILVTGGTIPLRLAEDVLIHGLKIPRGQMLYGVVTINNDRMLVHVRSLRIDRNLYSTDLQVYDLDGLQGIHIPGMVTRDVAKESADEGVSGLNLDTYEPGLGAQAANAGIQAAKTLFSRKVKQVRVSVRAGYQVLLRNNRASGPSRIAPPVQAKDSSSFHRNAYTPPGFVPGGIYLDRCRQEDMELDLHGIYLEDSLLWFSLRWQNHSPIGYAIDYCRWSIRDRRTMKRTAQQELPVEPVFGSRLELVAGDSTRDQWIGFRPFALPKDKELVVEVGERNGGRSLTLVIGHRQLLKAKQHEEESGNETDGKDNRALY
jgi:hypothetical protein